MSGDVDAAEDPRVLRVAVSETARFDHWDHIRLRDLASRPMKNGAPITAVRMPSGISAAVIVRERVSMTVR